MQFFHLFDLTILVIKRQSCFDFSLKFILTEEHRCHINYIRVSHSHKQCDNCISVIETFLLPPKIIFLQKLKSDISSTWLVVFFSETFQTAFSVLKVNIFEVLFIRLITVWLWVRLHFFPETNFFYYKFVSDLILTHYLTFD